MGPPAGPGENGLLWGGTDWERWPEWISGVLRGQWWVRVVTTVADDTGKGHPAKYLMSSPRCAGPSVQVLSYFDYLVEKVGGGAYSKWIQDWRQTILTQHTGKLSTFDFRAGEETLPVNSQLHRGHCCTHFFFFFNSQPLFSCWKDCSAADVGAWFNEAITREMTSNWLLSICLLARGISDPSSC